MTISIKLRRSIDKDGNDDCYFFEVGFDEKSDKLVYRSNYGWFFETEIWEGEDQALKFLLGPIRVTSELRNILVEQIKELPDLVPIIDSNLHICKTNF